MGFEFRNPRFPAVPLGQTDLNVLRVVPWRDEPRAPLLNYPVKWHPKSHVGRLTT